MGRRVLVLAAGVGSGHNMAARVLEEVFGRADGVAEVKRLDVLDSSNRVYRSLYDDGYFTLVEAVPWLVGWGYDAGDPPFKLGNSLSLLDLLNTTATVRAIRAFAPDIIVCTHFLPARLVSLLIARGSLAARLAVVTTDYDFQGLWLSSPFHHFFVARDETKAHLSAIGVPSDRVSVSGIPVHPGLGEPVDRAAVLRRYDLRDDEPVVLVSAGAAGGAYTRAVVQQTLRMRSRTQIVIVCGRNAELKRSIEGMVALERHRYRVLGYTTDMPDLLRTAALFVGKPGGLSSSECMAAGLPMVLVDPIPGQEVRNSDFLLEEGAAVRCNYETTIGYKLDQLLADPARIDRMAAAARRIGRADAGREVVSTVLADDAPPLWISAAAQQSVLESSERGIAAVSLYAGQRIRTLVDPATGISAAVITAGQLDALQPLNTVRDEPTRNVRLSSARMINLVRETRDPGLALVLHRLLGRSSQLQLRVS